MPEPYTAVGLIPTVWGIKSRSEIQKNLEHISHLIKAASWLSSLDQPVRLIAIPLWFGAMIMLRYAPATTWPPR